MCQHSDSAFLSFTFLPFKVWSCHSPLYNALGSHVLDNRHWAMWGLLMAPYSRKLVSILGTVENVQKWTFSIVTSISPNSIIALKRLILLVFRKSSNVISASRMILLSKSSALFVPCNNGCLGVTQCLPSYIAMFVNEVS